MLAIPTDRRQEGLPADMLHAVRPCRFATHRLSYRRAAAGHALWLRNYWPALRKMPLVAFEGAGVRQVPVLRPVLHVDGVAGLGPTDTTALVSGHHQCHSAARCGVQLQPAQPITGSPEAWFLE